MNLKEFIDTELSEHNKSLKVDAESKRDQIFKNYFDSQEFRNNIKNSIKDNSKKIDITSRDLKVSEYYFTAQDWNSGVKILRELLDHKYNAYCNWKHMDGFEDELLTYITLELKQLNS